MKKNAGILLYRFAGNVFEVFLVHPGGPYWVNKDLGSWSIPKGEAEENEDLQSAAIRELEEETMIKVTGPFLPLSPVKQKSGKTIYVWALEKEVDETRITSNNFEIEWPPGSGIIKSFPEIDRAAWFGVEEAEKKIAPGQLTIIEELIALLQIRR